jgi:hypothetical protein
VMRLQGETRELSVTLTPEELEDRGADLAAAVRNADQKEAHMEGRKAAWREELKGLKEDLHVARTEASKLAEIVRTGKERRDVDLTWKYAIPDGWAFLVRNDTGERVQSRKLKDEERQLTLGEPPYAEATPEELAEWLATLPVNEAEVLPEGHAGDVHADDHDPLLDPGGFASDTTDEDGNTLGGDDGWDESGPDVFPEGEGIDIAVDLRSGRRAGSRRSRPRGLPDEELLGEGQLHWNGDDDIDPDPDDDDDPALDTEEEILSNSSVTIASSISCSGEAEQLVKRSRAKR